MNSTKLRYALHLLDTLQRELIDNAFELERLGRLDAADLAVATAYRISLTTQLLRTAIAPRGGETQPAEPPNAELCLCQ